MIRDITPDFLTFWEKAQNRPTTVQRQLWQDLYEGPNRDVFDIYFSRYGNRQNLNSAFQKYDQIVGRVQEIAPHIDRVIEQIVPTCASLFECEEHELPFVLMVGVFNSDAWVTELSGQATTFLALEADVNSKLSSLPITIAHEVTHGLHARCSNLKMNSTLVGEGLFLEGLAVCVSRIVVPDAPEVSYLCPGGEQTLAGQDCREWLDECRNRYTYVCEQLLANITQADEETYASYFWSREQTRRTGIPLRVGYVVGYDLVRQLHQQYPIAEMARWTPEQVMKKTRQQLERLCG